MADLDFTRHYLRTLKSIVSEIKVQGGTADTAASYPIPDEFNHLVNLAGMYQDSMRFLFERTSA
jgi:hypothetical protein